MKSDRTMLLLANTFISLTETHPIDKITISKIVETCGKNRKTFYYYFFDVNSLIVWLFRHDLGLLLTESISEDKLVYENRIDPTTPCNSNTSRFPYYIFNKTGVRTLDHSKFFALLARVFDRRREYYSKIFRHMTVDPNDLRSYLYRLYLPAIHRDIEFILGNRYLQPRNIELLAEFYTGSFLNDLVFRTISGSCKSVEEDFSTFGNLIHNALSREIEEQRLHRRL